MKVMKIISCINCPYLLGLSYCNLKDRSVEDENIELLPEWCPLEDYEFQPTYIEEE